MLAWLSVWSEVQTCIWPSWCHCHSLSFAPVKSRLVLGYLSGRLPAHPGSPGQRAVKRMYVCMYCFFFGHLSVQEFMPRRSRSVSEIKRNWNVEICLHSCCVIVFDALFLLVLFFMFIIYNARIQQLIWWNNIKTWTGLSAEESIRMTEDRDKWRKYLHSVANPRIEDG